AMVWVEGANLRDRVHNLEAYAQWLELTRTQTRLDGSFVLRLDEGFYHLMVEKPGYFLARTQPVLNGAGADRHDVRLVRDTGPDIIAHRGASFYAPENTIPAVQKAILLGADVVEVDVRVTRDGVPVLMHDRTVTRTTGAPGRVIDLDFEQVARLDAGAWFDPSFAGTGVPTLREALEESRRAGVPLMVDFKATVADEDRSWLAVRDELRGHPRESFIVASFRTTVMEHCSREGFRCGLLANRTLLDPVGVARSVGATELYLEAFSLRESHIAAAREAGIRLHVWTVNDPALWQTLVAYKVDGIITDYPGHLLDHLAGN
ncbi:MAG TPA: glycerophosphodiester phosphodiesterase family protein, partial [Candidatus Thermoplasmatota archaeon]|nr:glycerophosphodiester phosphodiesterase family protein [Candidatus Thermoplasmatota archaeon]